MNINRVLNLVTAPRTSVPYDTEAPVTAEVRRLSYTDFSGLADAFDGTMSRTNRSHLRYLAALLPDLDVPALARVIHEVLDNPRVTVGDVRLILDGRSLADPTRRTREVPVEAIQTVGRLLARGATLVAASRGSGVHLETVEAIDRFLGLTQAHRDRMLDHAVEAVREGESVRTFAQRMDLSKSAAHRLLVRAREVLVELGEVAA
jgi:hypothetical protein